MSLLASLPLVDLTPSRVWSSLDPGTRDLAARALYARGRGRTEAAREEANLAIAHALRFRESAVRQLPVERRVHYLARAVRPGDSLATSLLIALHLESRGEMLALFLDALGIPHEEGLIDEDHRPTAPDAASLETAALALFGKFPAAEVELYLASLLSVDPETWSALAPFLERRNAAGSSS